MFQSSGFPARLLPERWRGEWGPRATGAVAALLVEALLLLLLLSLNQVAGEKAPAVVHFATHNVEEQTPKPEPSRPSSAPAAARASVTPPPPEVPVPAPTVPPQPVVAPVPLIPLPRPFTLPAAPAARPAPPAPVQGPAYGPADSGGGGGGGLDKRRVGTAPNGEPMYAAAWYTKPTDSQLRGFLSTATPGSALITCRTVADYRVEDCVGLSEFPEGSQMLRAVLAAAWQFRVRPPRRGGQVMVGAWVRIRIDYSVTREGDRSRGGGN